MEYWFWIIIGAVIFILLCAITFVIYRRNKKEKIGPSLNDNQKGSSQPPPPLPSRAPSRAPPPLPSRAPSRASPPPPSRAPSRAPPQEPVRALPPPSTRASSQEPTIAPLSNTNEGKAIVDRIIKECTESDVSKQYTSSTCTREIMEEHGDESIKDILFFMTNEQIEKQRYIKTHDGLYYFSHQGPYSFDITDNDRIESHILTKLNKYVLCTTTVNRRLHKFSIIDTDTKLDLVVFPLESEADKEYAESMFLKIVYTVENT